MKVKSTEIVLQFKVWCPSFNRIRHRLFLLGSLPELGAWNIYDALEAHPTADNHTWQVDVIVPHESTFEWVWLKTGLNRTGVEWERSTKRNRTVGYFSGVLHSVWANSEEVYLQSATFAEVTTYLSIDDGYTLVLTGSTPTTGLWDLSKAVPAIEFPKKSGFWKALVSFDALTSLDFQWAVVKEKDFTSVRQQEKVKHSITGRRCWMRIVAPWMLPVTGIVDISIINDTLDTVHGRTSVIVRERRKRIEEIISWTNDSNHSYMEAKNARRNFHVTTSSSESVERTKVSDIKRESSLNIIKQPAVRSNENLDELIQKNEERIVRETKTERFTKLLSDAYTELTNTLKGQGQTEMPPDPFTMDELDNLRQTASGQKPSSSDQPKVVLTAGSVDEFDPEAKIKKMADVRLELTGSEGYVAITSRHSSESDMEDATIAGVSSCTTQFSVGTPSEYILSNTHQCDVSSSMSHVVASDTGFTELAISWMSSFTSAPRLSPPQITQQEIQTPLADLDEGFSEAEATLVDRLDRYSAMETGRINDKPRDTSPVLMTSLAENTRTRPQPEDTPSSYEDDTFALEEDDAHLDWLAERVQFEEDFYGTQQELGMHLDLSTLKDEPIALPSLDFKHKSSGFNKTTPDQWSHPTPEPVIQGSPNYTFFDDTFSESLSETRSSLRNLSNARAIAREIEEKWGAGLHSQEAIDYDLPGNEYSTESVYYDISGLHVSNQVPLLDGGLCLLMYSKTSLEETPSDTELPPTQNLSVNEDIGTSLSAGLLVLPAPREMYSNTENKLVDDILSNVDLFKKMFLSSTQVLKTTPSEEPLVETLIANVSTYPPPTWSMLQEENIEVTKNPSINARMRTKTAVKVVPMIKALQSRTDPPKPYSEKNLMEPSSSRGPFQLAGVSDVKGPLVIGADDTSKSPTEIDDERSNRQMWTNMRKHTSDLLRLDDVSSSQVDEESMV